MIDALLKRAIKSGEILRILNPSALIGVSHVAFAIKLQRATAPQALIAFSSHSLL